MESFVANIAEVVAPTEAAVEALEVNNMVEVEDQNSAESRVTESSSDGENSKEIPKLIGLEDVQGHNGDLHAQGHDDSELQPSAPSLEVIESLDEKHVIAVPNNSIVSWNKDDITAKAVIEKIDDNYLAVALQKVGAWLTAIGPDGAVDFTTQEKSKSLDGQELPDADQPKSILKKSASIDVKLNEKPDAAPIDIAEGHVQQLPKCKRCWSSDAGSSTLETDIRLERLEGSLNLVHCRLMDIMDLLNLRNQKYKAAWVVTLKRTLRTRLNDVFKHDPPKINREWEEDRLHKISLLLRGRSINPVICCHEVELHDGFLQRFLLVRLQESIPQQSFYDCLGPMLAPEVAMQQINPMLSSIQVCSFLKLHAEAFGQIIFNAKAV